MCGSYCGKSPCPFLRCAPDDLDSVQEERESLQDENKVLTDTIAEFTNAFSKHILEYFGAVGKSAEDIESNGART